MPGKINRTYDPIVVGTGMSGGWAIKELCEKDLKVLALERGQEIVHGKNYNTAMKAPCEMPHNGSLDLQYKKDNPVLVRSGVVDEFTKHLLLRIIIILIYRTSLSTGYGHIIQAAAQCIGGDGRSDGANMILN